MIYNNNIKCYFYASTPQAVRTAQTDWCKHLVGKSSNQGKELFNNEVAQWARHFIWQEIKTLCFVSDFFFSFKIARFLNNALLQNKISRKVHSESIWTEWSPTNEIFFKIICSAWLHILNRFICCWFFFPPQKMSACTNNEFTPSPPLWIQRMAIIGDRGIAEGVVYWQSSLVLLLIRDPFFHRCSNAIIAQLGSGKGHFSRSEGFLVLTPEKESRALLSCWGVQEGRHLHQESIQQAGEDEGIPKVNQPELKINTAHILFHACSCSSSLPFAISFISFL